MSEPIRRRGPRILLAQLLVLALAAGAGVVWWDGARALAAAAGGAVSVLLLWMLRVTMQKAAETAAEDPQGSSIRLYVGAGVRFVLLLVLFAIGLGLLGLDPVGMIAGYAVVQAAGVLAAQGNLRRSDVPEYSKK
ncbi:MAG: ATP synthase subunit I [Halothiobacillaceae bacterium]